jgi:hypothetical protein
MIQITLNIGTEIRGDGLPLTSRELADGLRTIESEGIRLFGGYTVTQTLGAWRAPSGAVHVEKGISIEILTDRDHARTLALELAAQARDAMRQACVLLRVAEVSGEFV